MAWPPYKLAAAAVAGRVPNNGSRGHPCAATASSGAVFERTQNAAQHPQPGPDDGQIGLDRIGSDPTGLLMKVVFKVPLSKPILLVEANALSTPPQL